MTKLFVDPFVTWYEVHWKVIPGSDDGYVCTLYKYHIMNFSRDDNGNLEISNRTYSREKVTLRKGKYTNEVCLCMGVATMTPIIDCVEKPKQVRR